MLLLDISVGLHERDRLSEVHLRAFVIGTESDSQRMHKTQFFVTKQSPFIDIWKM